MAQVQQKVYLISEEQRAALLNYLQERPFKEVATGIQFLLNSPTATLNVEAPDSEETESSGEAIPAEVVEVPVAA
jgi:hypothetical protein